MLRARKRVVGLFAGVAGFELGLRSAGFTTVAFAENDPYASAVLSDRFRDTPNLGDLSNLRSLPAADVIAAGFPCQDLSPAGRLDGIHGAKSRLVGDVFRLIAKMRTQPMWLLFENVPFLLNFDGGSGMRWLTQQLEKLKCTWAYRIVDTQAFGLPQRRRRLYVLASATADPRPVLLTDGAEAAHPKFDGRQACGFYWTEGNRGVGWAIDAVPPLKGTSGVGIASPPGVWLPHLGRIVTPSIADAEALQGFARGWTKAAESRLRGDGMRWRLVGNAVSVPVAAWIGKSLAAPRAWSEGDSVRVDLNRPWPKAGWGHKGARYSVAVSEWPIARARQSLASMIQGEPVDLSLRASKGFMNRLLESSLKADPAFVRDLKAHVERLQSASPEPVDEPPNEGDAGVGQSFREEREVEPVP